ncbi:MAG: hypothetical protein A3H42_01905 [Deltaproteobacteria bacterium RIFCSPLOWO2_02_FULL_46_8]|nr:MAG: hypothetical protein A3H42_01905 [Deltaproteobacteria bacterium RIFCSPLOWO2_02_FULL_46_8]
MRLFERLFSGSKSAPSRVPETFEKSWAERNTEATFDRSYTLFVAPDGRVMARLLREGGQELEGDLFLEKLEGVARQYEERIEHPDSFVPTARIKDRIQESDSDADQFALEQVELQLAIARRRIQALRDSSSASSEQKAA